MKNKYDMKLPSGHAGIKTELVDLKVGDVIFMNWGIFREKNGIKFISDVWEINGDYAKIVISELTDGGLVAYLGHELYDYAKQKSIDSKTMPVLIPYDFSDAVWKEELSSVDIC